MSNRRIERLNEQLKRELAALLRTRIRDPRVEGVTVTGVKTAPDLTLARVAVHIAGDADARKEALEGLEATTPYLRRTLGQELHIRRVPELSFEVDRSLERAARIETLLDQVRPEGGWQDEDDGGEPDTGEGDGAA